jgi:hypothetical protein
MQQTSTLSTKKKSQKTINNGAPRYRWWHYLHTNTLIYQFNPLGHVKGVDVGKWNRVAKHFTVQCTDDILLHSLLQKFNNSWTSMINRDISFLSNNATSCFTAQKSKSVCKARRPYFFLNLLTKVMTYLILRLTHICLQKGGFAFNNHGLLLLSYKDTKMSVTQLESLLIPQWRINDHLELLKRTCFDLASPMPLISSKNSGLTWLDPSEVSHVVNSDFKLLNAPDMASMMRGASSQNEINSHRCRTLMT